MSDLIERLREFDQDGLALATRAGNARWLELGKVAKDAADEIERLRAAIADASHELGSEDFMPRAEWRRKHESIIQAARGDTDE